MSAASPSSPSSAPSSEIEDTRCRTAPASNEYALWTNTRTPDRLTVYDCPFTLPAGKVKQLSPFLGGMGSCKPMLVPSEIR